MPKFTKTVTCEMLDVCAISEALHSCRTRRPVKAGIRMVMSGATKQAIITKFDSTTLPPMSTIVTFKRTDLFEGCPVDTNDSLEFGEVLFTYEL